MEVVGLSGEGEHDYPGLGPRDEGAQRPRGRELGCRSANSPDGEHLEPPKSIGEAAVGHEALNRRVGPILVLWVLEQVWLGDLQHLLARYQQHGWDGIAFAVFMGCWLLKVFPHLGNRLWMCFGKGELEEQDLPQQHPASCGV